MPRLIILLVLPFVAIQLILNIAVIVSVARKPLAWSDKWPWLLVIFVNIIGPIIYFVIGSNMLDEKAAHFQDTREDSQ